MKSQLQKQHFCLILHLEVMETVRRPLFKSDSISFSGVDREKDSKCTEDNIKIQFLYFIWH